MQNKSQSFRIFKSVLASSVVALFWGACSDKQAGGTSSETQNAEVTLVESKPGLYRANALDTLRRWEFDLVDTNLTWTLQLQGSLENASLESAWQAHFGPTALTFEEKILQPLSFYNGKIVKSEVISTADSTFIDVDFELVKGKTIFYLQSKLIESNSFDTLVAGKGTLWQFRTKDGNTKLFYGSCSGQITPSEAETCVRSATLCDNTMPLMCTSTRKPLRPSYTVDLNSIVDGHVAEWSQGWSQYSFEIGPLVLGSEIISKAYGDSICQNKFGSFSEWASDSLSKFVVGMNDLDYIEESFKNANKLTGGFGFYGYWESSTAGLGQALWVHKNEPLGNCWWE